MRGKFFALATASVAVILTMNCDLPTSGNTDISVTGVSLDSISLHLLPGSSPVSLQAVIEPEDATNAEISWSSDNGSVATVNSNGLVTPKAAGTATITVTTDDGNFSASCIVVVQNQNPILGTWTVTSIQQTGNVTTMYVTDGVADTTRIARDTTLDIPTNDRVSRYATNGYRYDTYVFNIKDTVQYVFNISDSTLITTYDEGVTGTEKFSLAGNTATLSDIHYTDTIASSTNPFTGTVNYVIFTGEQIVTMTKN